MNNKNKQELEFEDIDLFLDNFISYCESINKLNKKLAKRKIRNPNFPSEISENIVKYYIQKTEGKKTNWNIKSGDLIVNDQIIEVKAFTSNGPSSFGPSEKWNEIFFVDATNFKTKTFKIYNVKLSNNNEIWGNIKINSKQTYKSQCKEKRRPRIAFRYIKSQISNYVNKIFDGTLDKLK
tara:strand:- start:31835 stop:32374 length:540 start_codon:yes stop_codon:yes gene_type:complete